MNERVRELAKELEAGKISPRDFANRLVAQLSMLNDIQIFALASAIADFDDGDLDE